jgi:hypothetical protein
MGTLSKLREKKLEYLSFLVDQYYDSETDEKKMIRNEIVRMLPDDEEYVALAKAHIEQIDKEPALPLSRDLYDALTESGEQTTEQEQREEAQKREREINFERLYKRISSAQENHEEYSEILKEMHSFGGDDLFLFGKNLSERLGEPIGRGTADILIYLMKEAKSKDFIDGVFKAGYILLSDGSYGQADYHSEDWTRSCFIDWFFQYSYSGPDEDYYMLKRPDFSSKNTFKSQDELLAFVIDNFDYKHIFFSTIFSKYSSDNFFSLGKLFRDRFPRIVDIKIAELLNCLLTELNSKEFIDGVFYKGDIYCVSNFEDYNHELKNSDFLIVEYEEHTCCNEGYPDIEHWRFARTRQTQ